MSARTRARLILGGGAVLLMLGLVALALVSRPSTPVNDRAQLSVEQAIALGILDREVIDQLRATGEGRAIVYLDTAGIVARLGTAVGADRTLELMASLKEEFGRNKQAILSLLGPRAELVRDFERLGAFVVDFRSEDGLLATLRSPLVRAVYADLVVSVPESPSEPVGESVAVSTDYQGEGVAIGILDTGVDVARDPGYFPSGSVAGTFEAAQEDGTDDDAKGHGTHVASIVLMIAPRAQVYVADVFELQAQDDGTRRLGATSVLAGLDWLLDVKAGGANLRAVNLSLGRLHFQGECADRYALADVFAQGVIPVVSAGNSAFRDAEGKETDEYQPGMGDPACAKDVLSVGNVTNGSCGPNDTFDRVSPSSQSSEKLQMWAPGSCILAAGGSKSGTSMAAPHVAGAVAVLASARMDAQPAQIKAALVGTGPPIADPNSGVVRNRLDVAAALEHLLTGTAPIATPPVRSVIEVTMGPGPIAPGQELLSGESYTLQTFGVRNGGSASTTYHVEAADPDLSLLRQIPASWFDFSPSVVTLQPGAIAFVVPRIHIPADAEPGNYGAVIVSTDTATGATSGTFLEHSSVSVRLTIAEGSPAGGIVGAVTRALLGPLGVILLLGGLVLYWLRRRSRAGP